MNDIKASKDSTEEKEITVSINGKETNSFPLKDMIKRKRTIKDIVMLEVDKSPEILAADQFFVYVNGKLVKPKNVRNVRIENVRKVEIFDKALEGSTEKSSTEK
jgi:hypothetical protein